MKTSASSNRKKNELTIGVIASEKFLKESGSFYWRLYSEISLTANERGHLTLLEVVGPEAENRPESPKLITLKKADALIVLGAFKDSYLELIDKTAGMPVMALDLISEKITGDAVVADNINGGFKMTEYLIDKGFQKIGYVGTLRTTPSIDDRYIGYYKAMLFHGLKVNDKWLVKDRDEKTGYVDTKNCFRLPEKKDMPSAFFCNSDFTAQILIKKLKEAGYTVPKDISVVGFDHFLPEKTEKIDIVTYEIDLKKMAREAVRLLDEPEKKKDRTFRTVVVRGCVIEGNSVSAPAQ